MSTEDRFKAAVEIIRSLPKSGSFQPPYAMQLAFYSYYKQATIGTCKGPRPSFWDVVGKAKYDAWQKLGNMGKETAMQRYVDEFVSTIKKLQANATPEEVQEALSYAEPKHMALLKPLFEEGVNKKVKPVAATRDNNRESPSDDDIEKIDAHMDSEEEYSDTFNHIEEDRHSSEQADIVNSQHVQNKNSRNLANQRRDDGRFTQAGGGDLRDSGPLPPSVYHVSSNSEQLFSPSNRATGGYSGDSYGNAWRTAGGGRHPNHPVGYVQPVDNLSYAVVRLQYTMDEVVRRLEKLEHTLHEQRARRWSFFGGIQPHVFAAILGWPLLLQLALYLLRRRTGRLQLRLQ